MKKNKINLKLKNRKGSMTIIALYIFIIISISSTLVLMFASSQAALSRNQLEKIQGNYRSEDALYNLVYDEQMIDKCIKEKIFKIYRTGFKADDGMHDIIVDKDNPTMTTIKKAIFKLEKIDGKENIVFELITKQNKLDRKIIGSGNFIGQIFEMNKELLIEEELDSADKELFLKFIDKIKDENCDYDCKLNNYSKKLNLYEDTRIAFNQKSYSQDELFHTKTISQIKDNRDKEILKFSNESIILNLKSEEKNKSLIIGEADKTELIKVNGVLYIEGDLIIEQDFEFSGIIIINDGKLLINSKNKPKINGMIFLRDNEIDIEKIDILYDQKAIYKEGSFLPGFIDIEIDTIKKY